MRKTILSLTLITGIAVISVVSCEMKSSHKEESKADNEELVKRGEYLVSVIGCDDCHSPKKMGANGPEIDMDLRLSGYPSSRPLPPVDSNVINKGWYTFNGDLTAAVGPWGVSYAANLTSDETGIGNWSEDQFRKAFTQGKWKGMDNSRPLMPPMPWQNFRNMKDEDVRAIFAFLKSTKPVKNIEPPIRPLNEL